MPLFTMETDYLGPAEIHPEMDVQVSFGGGGTLDLYGYMYPSLRRNPIVREYWYLRQGVDLGVLNGVDEIWVRAVYNLPRPGNIDPAIRQHFRFTGYNSPSGVVHSSLEWDDYVPPGTGQYLNVFQGQASAVLQPSTQGMGNPTIGFLTNGESLLGISFYAPSARNLAYEFKYNMSHRFARFQIPSATWKQVSASSGASPPVHLEPSADNGKG